MTMQLISNWKEGWRFYSVWAFALLGALPELWPLLVAVLGFDPMPELPGRVVQLVALIGLVSRFIKQTKPPLPPVQG